MRRTIEYEEQVSDENKTKAEEDQRFARDTSDQQLLLSTATAADSPFVAG